MIDSKICKNALLIGLILFALHAWAGGQTPLKAERVATGFNRPIFVTAPAGDYDRVFVVEQRGLVRIIKDGAVLSTPFIDVSSVVSQGASERGLLGMAFHPDYTDNGWFYLCYTTQGAGDSVIERYTVSGADPDMADPASGLVVFGPLSQPFANHNGGCIQFGPDGKLYFALGDGGDGGDPFCYAQNKQVLYGKIVRLNDDGTVPADNPFVGDPDYLDEIWALGLRNPWRFSFDRLTGDMYIGDVGQAAIEEIDFQPASSTGGENYGWKVMEGTACFSTSNCDPDVPPCGDPRLTLPIFEYSHNNGRCSITGGYVYRGCAIPDLRGAYFFADYCTSEIISFHYDGSNVTDLQNRTAELEPGGGLDIKWISSFGEDADGELYITDLGTNETNGEVYKIVPDTPPAFEDLGFGLAGSGGIVPVLEICGQMGTGDTALLRLCNAVPQRTAVLVFSASQNPRPKFGGTLVPGGNPKAKFMFHTTDDDGVFTKTFTGGGGPKDIYVQFLVDDPGAPQGVAFSNAVKALFQP